MYFDFPICQNDVSVIYLNLNEYVWDNSEFLAFASFFQESQERHCNVVELLWLHSFVVEDDMSYNLASMILQMSAKSQSTVALIFFNVYVKVN